MPALATATYKLSLDLRDPDRRALVLESTRTIQQAIRHENFASRVEHFARLAILFSVAMSKNKIRARITLASPGAPIPAQLDSPADLLLVILAGAAGMIRAGRMVEAEKAFRVAKIWPMIWQAASDTNRDEVEVKAFIDAFRRRSRFQASSALVVETDLEPTTSSGWLPGNLR